MEGLPGEGLRRAEEGLWRAVGQWWGLRLSPSCAALPRTLTGRGWPLGLAALTCRFQQLGPVDCILPCSCLTSLCWLDLGGNEMGALPRSLAGLTSLETVRCGPAVNNWHEAWLSVARASGLSCSLAGKTQLAGVAACG